LFLFMQNLQTALKKHSGGKSYFSRNRG